MHMKVSVTDDAVAVPAFGLNAGGQRGALLITSRSGSDTALVAVLESVPDGELDASTQAIQAPTNVDELALLETVMPAESGFIFDGVALGQVAYVYVSVTGSATIDVSFVENRLPVDLGKTGGRL